MARIKHGTLTATTVATVTITPDADEIEVVNVDGAAAIYFTADGSAPTVEGDDCEVVPATIGVLRISTPGDPPYTVKLISSGTPKYSVRAV